MKTGTRLLILCLLAPAALAENMSLRSGRVQHPGSENGRPLSVSYTHLDVYKIQPYAYGASAGIREGLLCIGGCGKEGHRKDVYLLNLAEGTVTTLSLIHI